MRHAFVLAGIFAFMTAPAFAQTSGMTGTAPADQAFMMGMDKMNASMKSAPLTGDADRDFVAMMMPHHQAAVDMAKTELQYGKDPTMRVMARNIIAAQDKEISEMKRWQANHPAK